MSHAEGILDFSFDLYEKGMIHDGGCQKTREETTTRLSHRLFFDSVKVECVMRRLFMPGGSKLREVYTTEHLSAFGLEKNPRPFDRG